jgi:hypothetical protein
VNRIFSNNRPGYLPGLWRRGGVKQKDSDTPAAGQEEQNAEATLQKERHD